MSSRSFFYTACGLSIASDAPIAGLREIATHTPADVTISMRRQTKVHDDVVWTSVWYVSPELDASGRPELTIEAGEPGYRLTYSEGATFLVDRTGRCISAFWMSPLTDEDAASYLTGSVLAFVLRLRGSLALHASAIAIDGRGHLFVGDAWAGKSSTAAAFSMLGYPVLSDDIVRIEVDDGDVLAYPSHPRLNMWSDSAAVLHGAADSLPAHSDTYRKHYLDLIEAGYAFQATPVPIEAIHVLGERAALNESPAIEAMRPRAALVALVRHTYGNCFLDRAMRAREFDVLSRLVERVPVRELRFGDSLEDLVSSCRVLATGWPVQKDRPYERS